VDQATSARARREVYVGPWLPEPVVDPLAVGARPSAEQVAELADDLSVALLLVLKRLSPLERAALTDPLDGDGARVSLAASAELAAGWQAAADLLHQCNEGATP